MIKWFRKRRAAGKPKVIAVLQYESVVDEPIKVDLGERGFFFSATGAMPSNEITYCHVTYLEEDDHGKRTVTNHTDSEHEMKMHSVYVHNVRQWLSGTLTHEEARAQQQLCDEEAEDNE